MHCSIRETQNQNATNRSYTRHLFKPHSPSVAENNDEKRKARQSGLPNCQAILTFESSASKQHDLLQLVFQFHHQSQKGPIFVHRDTATSNETLYQVDPLVDVIDDLKTLPQGAE